MTIGLFLTLDVLAVLYWRGNARMRLGPRRVVSFYAGLISLALALSSPFESRADTRLSAHMVQHLVLLLVAPALLAYGRPVVVSMLALPLGLRRAVGAVQRQLRFVGRIASHPAFACGIFAAALWTWHQPGLYQAAVRNGTIHALEHASFFAAALIFWACVIDSGPRRRTSYPAALLVVFGTMIESGWLAFVLSFTPRVIYPVYGSLSDQQLAGVVMWVPMTVVFVVTMALIVVRLFSVMETRMKAVAA